MRLKFWEELLTRAKDKGVVPHASRSPWKDNSISAGAAGREGLKFNYAVWPEEKSAVELYIDTGDKDHNKRLFDLLHAKKEKIEADFGGPLLWERFDDRRASRIRYVVEKGILEDNGSKWSSTHHEALIDAMDRLEKAIKPYIQGLLD